MRAVYIQIREIMNKLRTFYNPVACSNNGALRKCSENRDESNLWNNTKYFSTTVQFSQILYFVAKLYN